MSYIDFIDANIDKPKKIYKNSDSIKIGNQAHIKKDYYKFRGEEFCEIILHTKEEKFLGKFNKEEDGTYPNVEYKDGNILIGYKSNKENKYIKVYNLYNILDDMSCSLTEKEALEKFDSSIDTSLLKTPNKLINRMDVEKRIIKRI